MITKIAEDDLHIFKGFITDLFPGESFESHTHANVIDQEQVKVINAIEIATKEAGLDRGHDSYFIEKVYQLHRTI